VQLEIRKRPAAVADIIDIWLYTYRKWGDLQADRYAWQIDAAIKSLANDAFGRKTKIFGSIDFRSMAINRHRIFYRVIDGCIEIVRVLHVRMDAARYLS
jgi:toxin ParE1/3/4